MKRFAIGFLAIIFLLSACGQSSPVSVIENTTSTPSLLPTNTSSPTHIPTASTSALVTGASVTPLPTIPTFTPTFDVSTIVTVTPAPKAECPVEKQDQPIAHLLPENGDPYDGSYINQILEFLNSGGTVNIVSTELKKPNKWGLPYGDLTLKDITNDGVSELFITILFSHFVLKCDSQTYEFIYSREGVTGGTKLFTSDLNKNSVLELQVSISPCADTFCPEMWLYEWDGTKLKTLIHNTDDVISTADINGDGVTEIIGIEFPWSKEYDLRPTGREITRIYFWNGYYFIEQTLYSDALFRFQAIQDADNEVTNGNFNKAFQLYDEAVGNKNLEWWSPERNKYEIDRINAQLNFESLPSTQPTLDLTEYPRLAAYAYYRIMLLHLVQGNESEAITTYNTLLETFGNDPYARPYVEMATAFWDAYQSTHKMYDGCTAAIQYAVEHSEILIPLGSDYHGAQSHIYVPEDVCPFR